MISHEESPTGPLLMLIAALDSICSLFHYPNWREALPFGIGLKYLSHELPKNFVSGHYPKLPSYADFLIEHRFENNLSNLYKYAFETPTTALGVLTTRDAMVTLFILVLILRQIKSMLCPFFCSIGRTLAKASHGPEWEKDNEEKIFKFGEYVFRLLYHSAASIYGLYYFMDKPWWDRESGGTTLLWQGYPHHEIEPEMAWYYLIQSAYNVDAILSLIQLSFVFKIQSPFASKNKTFQSLISVAWSPTCRGDFREMAIHHIITNFLVIGSSSFHLTRPGSMVFLVHDISDVPIDLSKLANFMKWKVTTIICFVTMVIVWAISRLGILPFVIFKSVLTETHLATEPYLNVPGIDPRLYYMVRPPFYALFIGIIALHVFWFYMFLQIGYNLVFKNEIHDLSEHKNGEEQYANGKKIQ